MKERDRVRAAELDEALLRHSADQQQLAGVANSTARTVFVRQLIDSLHRVEYPRKLLERLPSPRRTDPGDEEFFDPIRAAVFHAQQGNHDEACWMVFLFVTYGKGKHTGWRLIRDIYGRLGQGGRWDWAAAAADPAGMAQWIVDHAESLWPKGTPRPFGAHRQHESVAPSGKTVETYLRWIGSSGHRAKFDSVGARTGGNPQQTFDILYHEMLTAVYRYGRLAVFDYLAMLGKLDLAAVLPGSTYLAGATGPVSGARLLFADKSDAPLEPSWLENQLTQLDNRLGVGMQVLEDALCNWQKSPSKFKAFRG